MRYSILFAAGWFVIDNRIIEDEHGSYNRLHAAQSPTEKACQELCDKMNDADTKRRFAEIKAETQEQTA